MILPIFKVIKATLLSNRIKYSNNSNKIPVKNIGENNAGANGLPPAIQERMK